MKPSRTYEQKPGFYDKSRVGDEFSRKKLSHDPVRHTILHSGFGTDTYTKSRLLTPFMMEPRRREEREEKRKQKS